MSRAPTFAFIPEEQLVEKHKIRTLDKYVVTISPKYGTISFSMDYIRDHSLNGKFIKFVADPTKNVIGWRALKEGSLPSLRGYRQVKVKEYTVGNSITRTCKLGIGELLEALKVHKDKKTLKALPIKNYKSQELLVDGGVDYVDLS